ncbi:MAG: bifunctional precorrin-2 dehydrogenase/sirohydrochlorin ferrochelatase, partial [Myxococcaceae bacterium]
LTQMALTLFVAAPVILLALGFTLLRRPRAATSTSAQLDFPIALRLHGRQVLMVGAGPISERRVQQLLEVGAHVHVVAPQATKLISELAAAGKLRWSQRAFEESDCAEPLIAFAATNDRSVNAAVYAAAHRFGHLANAADDPELCDFYVPSIGREGPITIAVSTAGLAPSLGAHLRTRLLKSVSAGDARLAQLIGRLRRIIPGGRRRSAAFQSLIEGDAARLLEQGDRRGLDQLLRTATASKESGQ